MLQPTAGLEEPAVAPKPQAQNEVILPEVIYRLTLITSVDA